MDIDWREPSREADAWIVQHIMGRDVFWTAITGCPEGEEVAPDPHEELRTEAAFSVTRGPAYMAWCCCGSISPEKAPRYPELGGHSSFCLDVVPHYTADIADAWQIVKALARAGYWCQMRTPFGVGEYNDGYWCGFTPHLAGGWNGIPDDWTPAPTMPLAICAAACAWFDNTQRPTPPASAVSTPPRP